MIKNYIPYKPCGSGSESWAEEVMVDILTDYEIYAMCKSIRQQVWFLDNRYRADFVIEVGNGHNIILEVDGKQHFKDKEAINYTVERHWALEKLGYSVIHIRIPELQNREKVATKIEAAINESHIDPFEL